MAWTERQCEQFKNLLKTIPSEDVAIVTAYAWCKEFSLKFNSNDEHIARRWHRYFHTGSLETTSNKLCIYIKDCHGNWMPVKDMSTKATSIWTCLDRNISFMAFDATKLECKKMARLYANAAKRHCIEAKLVECLHMMAKLTLHRRLDIARIA